MKNTESKCDGVLVVVQCRLPFNFPQRPNTICIRSNQHVSAGAKTCGAPRCLSTYHNVYNIIRTTYHSSRPADQTKPRRVASLHMWRCGASASCVPSAISVCIYARNASGSGTEHCARAHCKTTCFSHATRSIS